MDTKEQHGALKWTNFWKAFREWMPPKDRSLEIIVGFLLVALIGIYFQYEDHEARKKMNIMQETLIEIVKTKSDVAISMGLLNYLGCANPQEIRHSAIALLQNAAPKDGGRNLREAIAACDKESSNGTAYTQNALNGLTTAANDRIFTTFVMHGRMFYRDRLWQEAADRWYSAMADLPQEYLHTRKVEWRDVQQARDAYEARKYLEAADLFERAYRNVVTEQ